MKDTNYTDNSGVQVADSAFSRLLAGLQPDRGSETQNSVGRAFPTRLLTGAIMITAAAVSWTAWNLTQMPSAAGTASLGLLGACVVAWFVTARAVFHYQRSLLANASAVREKEAMVRERDLLRTIIENLPDAIYAKDRDGRFVLNNLAHRESLGAKSQVELLGKSDFDRFPLELAKQFFADEQAIIQSGVPLLNQQQFKAVRFGDKMAERWSYSSKVLWRDPQGNVLGTVGITRDVHEHKMMEEALRKSEDKLRQFTTQLERSNRELTDFAYVASHDLQEPLRKIVVFGERLKEKCADGFTTEGQDYLARMQKAASRMQILINDLLAFSRVTTKAQPFVHVNLAQVAKDVVSDLEARIEQVKGRVELGQLPTIEAEPLQMRQLLQNLIGNALKFRRPEEAPVVKVTADFVSAQRPGAHKDSAEEKQIRLTVSDNGIGFDEKYLDRIFNVFQRLHTRNEYEGTGMGLAITRKIVLYHGGDITAKSKTGYGSTFIATFPISHPKPTQQ